MRSTCRRNRSPRPLPAWAPSMRPGRSARTNPSSLRPSSLRRGHYPQHRFQGGEGVVGDARPGHAGPADEGALARVGQAHDADVGDELQFQIEPALLSRLSHLREARRLAAGGGEAGVAPGPPCLPGQAGLLPVEGEVGQQLAAFFTHLRPHRHRDHQVLPVGAVPVVLVPRPSVLRLPVVVVGELHQCVGVAGGLAGRCRRYPRCRRPARPGACISHGGS